MKAKFTALQSPALTGALVAETTVHPVHLKLSSDSGTPVCFIIPLIFQRNAYICFLKLVVTFNKM